MFVYRQGGNISRKISFVQVTIWIILNRQQYVTPAETMRTSLQEKIVSMYNDFSFDKSLAYLKTFPLPIVTIPVMQSIRHMPKYLSLPEGRLVLRFQARRKVIQNQSSISRTLPDSSSRRNGFWRKPLQPRSIISWALPVRL